jgi:glycosyltransferase involved in cell wall biosynthesis
MNLYLFNDNEGASTYGIGTYLKELTEALENTFINVHLVHLRSIRPEFEVEKTDQVEHWYIPEVKNNNTFSGSASKIEGYSRNVVYLLRLHIKNTKDLVFHFNYNICQLLAKELKTVFNCKTVTTVHYAKWMLELNSNLLLLHSIKSKTPNLRSKREKSLVATDKYENLLYNEVDHIIALCRNMQNLLQTEYRIEPDKIVVIPNGLADIQYRLKEKGEVVASSFAITEGSGSDGSEVVWDTLRKKWHIPENELLILFAGRLDAVKGLGYLIKAFHKVLNIIPNCRLMIAGNGAFDEYMKDCEDIWMHITWTGRLDRVKLYELYSIADIGVMPSFHEQCSYVAIEMMMHGVPLVANTSTGLHEMVEDGISGLQIPVMEHTDRMEIDTCLLAEKMIYLLQNPDERQLLGMNARKRYEKFYTSKVMRENMINFYNTLF